MCYEERKRLDKCQENGVGPEEEGKTNEKAEETAVKKTYSWGEGRRRMQKTDKIGRTRTIDPSNRIKPEEEKGRCWFVGILSARQVTPVASRPLGQNTDLNPPPPFTPVCRLSSAVHRQHPCPPLHIIDHRPPCLS